MPRQEVVIRVDGKNRAVSTRTLLRADLLRACRARGQLEIDASDGDGFSGSIGASVIALTSGGRGWLMFMQEPGGSSFSTRANDACVDSNEELSFTLTNGQVDTYPERWTIPLAQMVDGVVHFVFEGTRDPRLCWHDDSKPERRP